MSRDVVIFIAGVVMGAPIGMIALFFVTIGRDSLRQHSSQFVPALVCTWCEPPHFLTREDMGRVPRGQISHGMCEDARDLLERAP